MNRNHSTHRGLIALVVAAVAALVGSATAGDAYWWTDNDHQNSVPQAGQEPPSNNPPGAGSTWTPGSTSSFLLLKAKRSLYIAVTNDNTGKSKTVNIEITATGSIGNNDLRGLWPFPANKDVSKHASGFKGASPKGGTVRRQASGALVLRLSATFSFCPDWEYIRLDNNSKKDVDFTGVTIKVTTDACEQTTRVGSGVEGDSRATCGCTTTPVAVTDIYNFPETVPTDLGIPAFFAAPPSTGAWSSEWVFQTPEGDPRPQGGVRWFTDGPGLAAGDEYTFGFSMLGDADARYEVHAFDALTGEFSSYVRDVRPGLTGWVSRHSTSGSLAMSLAPMPRGDRSSGATPEERVLPTVEPRLGGIETIAVALNRPVVLVDPGAVSVSDTTTTYVPVAVSLEDGDTTLVLDFAPGALPDQRAYHVDVAGAVADAYNGFDAVIGDTDCMVIALLGDADGDGEVSDDDVALIDAHLGEPVEDATVALDLDLDGFITPADAVIAQDHIGGSVLCPGSFPTVPWYEDFDDYDPGSSLHGGCGWKGWDDDPAFDAPVTDVQGRSPSQSLDIQLDSDLVHEYDGFDSGHWSYSAWQYIPSDYESAGGEPFHGSYFLLLNTYSDGGPYHWSVGVSLDSATGMLRAFHGDDTNSIQVPYVCDRWVKIQTIIDLEDDWTRVYYDDDLVTEYTWTGGIYGEGGGALDIAVVDLFANGSTSVYYDDLTLEPIEGCGIALDSDFDGDGLSKLDEFLQGTDSCAADTDGDGVADGDDNCPTTWNDGQEDADGNGIGDACDDEPEPCPGDIDGTGDVGFGDLLAILSAWGACGGCPEDLDGSGDVGFSDLLIVLTNWGPCV